MTHAADYLRRQVASGASVRQLAADLGVTERTVRNRLWRAGIPLPSTSRHADVDLEAIFAEYRTGAPVARLANRYGVGVAWLDRRLAEHGVSRDVKMQPKERALRFSQLADRRWLLERIAAGASVYAVARELGTDSRTIGHALRRHGLVWPPATADSVERLAFVDDPDIRRKAARRILAEATSLAKRAQRVLDGDVPPW